LGFSLGATISAYATALRPDLVSTLGRRNGHRRSGRRSQRL
jgi:hypothetical protein